MVAIGVVAVYWLKRTGSWVRGQLISLMSQLPAAFDDGVAPMRCGPAQPKRRRIARKRNAEAQASVQYEAESAIPAPPPAWSQPAPASLPKWAPHASRVLMECGHLSNRTGQQKRLGLSDCSGINSEMCALRELGTYCVSGLMSMWSGSCT